MKEDINVVTPSSEIKFDFVLKFFSSQFEEFDETARESKIEIDLHY